ncbi:hypothetical protein Tco_0331351 [Tanacetum coccineum]
MVLQISANFPCGSYVVHGNDLPTEKTSYFKDVKPYFWDDPLLFKNLCGSNASGGVVAPKKLSTFSEACHNGPHPGDNMVKIYTATRMSWIFEASRARGICPSITRASQSSASFGNPANPNL